MGACIHLYKEWEMQSLWSRAYEGHVDLVRRLIIGTTGVITWLLRVVRTITKSPDLFKYPTASEKTPALSAGFHIGGANMIFAIHHNSYCWESPEGSPNLSPPNSEIHPPYIHPCKAVVFSKPFVGAQYLQ